MEDILANLTDTIIDVALRLLFALAVIVVGMKLAKWLSKKFLKLRALSNVDPSVSHFMSSAIKILLYTLIFVTAAIILGIPATSFITVLGSAGLAIGLAMQGSLSNLAGSLMILVFKPFKIGDLIEFGTVKGTVEDINLFYTVLHTNDNKVITCPNGNLSNKDIINYSTKNTRRVDMVFNVVYDSDVDKVKALLWSCVESDERVLKDPAPTVNLTGQLENSLEFSVKMWCRSDDYWDIYYDTLEKVKKAFQIGGIKVPSKVLDIQIKK